MSTENGIYVVGDVAVMDQKKGAVVLAPPESFVDGKVEEHDGECVLHLWHPQWGGYGSHATATFGTITGAAEGGPGCFELVNYHDGEFPLSPGNEGKPFEVHCCSAEQFVDFGLKILRAQVDHQRAENGARVRVDPRWIARVQDQLRELEKVSDPSVVAWLDRLPVGKPASPTERSRIAEAVAAKEAGAELADHDDVMARALTTAKGGANPK